MFILKPIVDSRKLLSARVQLVSVNESDRERRENALQEQKKCRTDIQSNDSNLRHSESKESETKALPIRQMSMKKRQQSEEYVRQDVTKKNFLSKREIEIAHRS